MGTNALREFDICGDIFLIDLPKGSLSEKGREGNYMRFVDMKMSREGFEFLYDSIDKNIFKGTVTERNQRPDVFVVKLSVQRIIDPDHPDNQLKNNESLMRKLPVVDIGGTEFFLDMRLQEFRQVINPFNTIQFEEFTDTEKGMEILFDSSKRTVFHGTPDELKERQIEIKNVQLQPLWKLDPVGWIEFTADSGKVIDKKEQRIAGRKR
jgi:hypothetical protein